ncbi:nucleoside hydrolase [Paenibacillus qinlingensis]|uniref:Inosine-uridine nucleoside N-ribohydrolase n=1 Tax=Paenibacillus qinlingensis TaxID=1837343 RepID=A0ABU1NP38_9BACL|nr:nucleoside hydrolase [Paenibacillus qinlingensis]MDR6549230.1 inosine-uridine nucleoside N-ribohydrolase [Paenibacillus qinlingensis]
MEFPLISDEERIQRLKSRSGKIRMVLDTDTFNEIDDQFAVVYALQSPERLQVEAFYAAPFFNDLSSGPKDGMEKSYQELRKIVSLMARTDIPIYKGSETYLPGAETPVESEAARNLVERAMASTPEDPLYVVAIGAITNVASAILMEPRIIANIVVVWLGGHALHWSHTREFNLEQDIHGARVILNSGVPLVLIPCMGVASHLQTTLSEMKDFVKDAGEIGAYLYETFRQVHPDHYAYSRVIWDISTIAYLVNEKSTPSVLLASPIVSDEARWSQDPSRHLIRYVHYINRDLVFRDLFRKLRDDQTGK